MISLLFSLMATVQAAAPDLDQFGYQRDILTRNLSSPTEIMISLPSHMMSGVSERFDNIMVVDDQNNEVRFKALINNPKKYREMKVHSVSSAKEETLHAIADNDVLSTFEFDERVDRDEASWMVLDFGRAIPLSRLEIFTPSQATIRTYEVRGGLDLDSMKTLKKRDSLSVFTDFSSTPLVQFVKISFWGRNVKVDDVNAFIGREGVVAFTANPNGNYRFLYGNPELKSIRYVQRVTNMFNANEVTVGRERINPLIKTDIDGDGVNNNIDNCLFISNKNQKDNDGDRIGDACDNARLAKNRNQIDSDFDFIGDITDNCKFKFNPKQADRDKDGFGNECDTAHGKERSDSPINKANLMIVGILLCLAVSLAAIFVFQKKLAKSEEGNK